MNVDSENQFSSIPTENSRTKITLILLKGRLNVIVRFSILLYNRRSERYYYFQDIRW